MSRRAIVSAPLVFSSPALFCVGGGGEGGITMCKLYIREKQTATVFYSSGTTVHSSARLKPSLRRPRVCARRIEQSSLGRGEPLLERLPLLNDSVRKVGAELRLVVSLPLDLVKPDFGLDLCVHSMHRMSVSVSVSVSASEDREFVPQANPERARGWVGWAKEGSKVSKGTHRMQWMNE